MKLKDINPAKYNPRKDLQPGDAEYEKIKRSITEFNLVEPLVYNKRTNTLVGGHQRKKILEELGHDEVEVSVVDLPETEEKALNVILNKAQGDWDIPKLRDLLEGLDTGEIDIEMTGFDSDELEKLLSWDNLPEVGLQKEPTLNSECFVEIYCDKGFIEKYSDTLRKWQELDNVTINISG